MAVSRHDHPVPTARVLAILLLSLHGRYFFSTHNDDYSAKLATQEGKTQIVGEVEVTIRTRERGRSLARLLAVLSESIA
jgi:hypothetical protein